MGLVSAGAFALAALLWLIVAFMTFGDADFTTTNGLQMLGWAAFGAGAAAFAAGAAGVPRRLK
jgi:hypothetical protein